MAVLQGAGERRAEAVVPKARGAISERNAALARTLILASALTVGVELLLQRLAPPILAQVAPGSVGAVISVGDLAADGGAVLVLLTALALAASGRTYTEALALATAAVLLASLWMTPLTSLVVHTAVVAAAASLGLTVLRGARSLRSVGTGLAALAVIVGHFPLLADAALPGMSTAVVARPASELLVVAAALSLAWSLSAKESPGPWAWGSAIAAGVIVTGGLTFQPGFTSIGAIWVVGVTLALPPVFYIAAVSAGGLLFGAWLKSPADRPLAAAIVLLVTAGIQPQVLHHNLTALLALVILCGAALPHREEQ